MTKELSKEINEIKKSKFSHCTEATLTSNELLIMMEECKWTYCHIPVLGIFTLISKDEAIRAIRATLKNEYQVKIEKTKCSLKSIWIG